MKTSEHKTLEWKKSKKEERGMDYCQVGMWLIEIKFLFRITDFAFGDINQDFAFLNFAILDNSLYVCVRTVYMCECVCVVQEFHFPLQFAKLNFFDFTFSQ